MLPWMETPTSCPRFTSLSQSPAMTFSFSFSDDCIPTKSRLNGFSSLTKGNIQGPMWRLCRHFFYGSCWRKGICYLILTYSTSSSASPELTPLPTKSTIGSYRPDHVLEFFIGLYPAGWAPKRREADFGASLDNNPAYWAPEHREAYYQPFVYDHHPILH